MKSSSGLLAFGFLACGAVAASCVSGSTVDGAGGRTGSMTGQGGAQGGGQGGFTNTSQGGFTGGTSQGGFTGTSQGGFTGGTSQGGFTGGTSQGGTTGGAGAGMSGCPRSVPAIDNFDEANRGGPPTGGYFNVNCGQGSWYVYGDPAGTVVPPLSSVTPFASATPGNGGTGYGAHVNGSGFSMYGVGLGVNINSSGTTIKSYDASTYSGFTFFAMGTATSSNGANMIRVSVPTTASSSAGSGGICTPTATTYCDGHWGKVITLTAAWTQYTVKWSELTLDSGAIGGTAFTPNAMIGFHWQSNGGVGPPAVAAAMNMWVDDLAFAP